MRAYVVPQVYDRVRVLGTDTYAGLCGTVADEKRHDGPSLTARDCLIRFDVRAGDPRHLLARDMAGGSRWFHADDLDVVKRGGC